MKFGPRIDECRWTVFFVSLTVAIKILCALGCPKLHSNKLQER